MTLSGGQKMRVAAARAAFSDAELVLLDDPLAAVDAHVALHLIDQLICGYLAGRTRIIVTHSRELLRDPRVDRVVLLEAGRVAAMGPWATVAAHPKKKNISTAPPKARKMQLDTRYQKHV